MRFNKQEKELDDGTIIYAVYDGDSWIASFASEDDADDFIAMKEAQLKIIDLNEKSKKQRLSRRLKP